MKVLLSCFLFSLLFTSCDSIFTKYYTCECTNVVSGEKIYINTVKAIKYNEKRQRKNCKEHAGDNVGYTECDIK